METFVFHSVLFWLFVRTRFDASSSHAQQLRFYGFANPRVPVGLRFNVARSSLLRGITMPGATFSQAANPLQAIEHCIDLLEPRLQRDCVLAAFHHNIRQALLYESEGTGAGAGAGAGERDLAQCLL